MIDPRPPIAGLLGEATPQTAGMMSAPPRHPLWNFLGSLVPPATRQQFGSLTGHAPRIVEALMSMAPGAGDAIAARDSLRAGNDMSRALGAGDYGAAASHGLASIGAGLGALPMVPYVGGMTKKSIDPAWAARAKEVADWYMTVHGPRGLSAKERNRAVSRLADQLTPEDLTAPGLSGFEAARRRGAGRIPSKMNLTSKDGVASAVRTAMGGGHFDGSKGSGSSLYFDFSGGRVRVSDHDAIAPRSMNHTHEILVRRNGQDMVYTINGRDITVPAAEASSPTTLAEILSALKAIEE